MGQDSACRRRIQFHVVGEDIAIALPVLGIERAAITRLHLADRNIGFESATAICRPAISIAAAHIRASPQVFPP
jgi:hypothetical protein